MVHPDDIDLQSVVTMDQRSHEISVPAVAAKLRVLIRDFIRAVRSHRQEWEITDADKTRINDILRKFRKWCRLYVDDIVVVGDTLRDHIDRLRLVFATLLEYNICRIGFPSLPFLGKEIDEFGMTAKEEKLPHRVLRQEHQSWNLASRPDSCLVIYR
ncbi:hypothetical protein N7497_008163 [Penicillium chrysogenum]|nr:hypothetical protein N7497_008163 [Penicillium chrysogenum]